MIGIVIDLLKIYLWLFSAIVFGLWWVQGALLYSPGTKNKKQDTRSIFSNPEGYRSPAEHGLLKFEEHYLKTRDGVRIHSWLVLQEHCEKCPTILMLHGNAGNIGGRLPNAKCLFQLTGSNIMMVDYRGFGNSEGSPCEVGLIRDAQAALDFLRSREDIDSSKIFLYGQSLGGAVSIALAQLNPGKLCGVAVENTFTTIDEMGLLLVERASGVSKTWVLKALSYCFYFFVSNHWNSISRIRHLTVPILFFSGLADELIPPAMMQRLHNAAQSSSYRKFHAVPGGTHNDTCFRGSQLYYHTFSDFISRLISPPTPRTWNGVG